MSFIVFILNIYLQILEVARLVLQGLQLSLRILKTHELFG